MRRGKKLNGAKWYGKVSTAVFYISMFVLIAIPYIPENIFKALIFISTFCLALSFIMYIPVYIEMYREVKENI